MAVAEVKTEEDVRLVNRMRQLFTEARNAKRPKYDTWYRNYRLVHNRIGGKSSQAWAPAPRDSEVYPTCASLVAWMGDQHTTIEAVAAADPNSSYHTFMSKLAGDLSTVLQTNWTVLNYEREVKLAIWDAFMFDNGYLKAVWDQSLDGGMGNAMMRRIDPWSIYLDPNGTSLDDCEYIIEARRMSINEAERRWPASAEKLRNVVGDAGGGEIEERPSNDDPSTGGKMVHNFSSLQGVARGFASPTNKNDMQPKPGVIVYEFWVKENEVTAAKGDVEASVDVRWKVVVIAADVVLMNEYADDLVTYGSHPYSRYCWDDVGEMYGIALVDHLAHPQMYINRLLTALQHNAELIGNPVMLESAQSGIERTGIVNRPGQRLRLNGPGAMQNYKPEWMVPPDMPAGVNQLVEFWINRMDNVSGMTAAVKGGTATNDRMSTDTMSTMQESAFVRVRNALSNLEGTLADQAYKLADLIIDNFTDARFMATIGPSGENTALALRARHFTQPTELGAPPFKYAIVINAGASLPTSRTARMKEADQAFLWGIIDRQAWMEAHQYPNWQAVLQRVKEQVASGEFNPPGQRQRRQKGGSSA